MADVDRGNTFERNLADLKAEAQKQFSQPYARDLVTSGVVFLQTIIQTAWNIERGNSTGTATSRTMGQEHNR